MGRQIYERVHQTCRHCRRAKVSRPRGLCWTCWHDRGIRQLYPVTSKFARRGVGVTGGGKEHGEATSYRQGTIEKLAVLAERASLGLALFNPSDTTAIIGTALPTESRPGHGEGWGRTDRAWAEFTPRVYRNMGGHA